MRMAFAAAAGFLAAVSPVPATAQHPDSVIVARADVRHDDLDLTSEPGAMAMLARLDEAATKACGGKPTAAMSWDQLGQAKQLEHRRCKAAAIEGATLRLGAPLVRAAWLSKAKTVHHAAKTR